jgi:poly-gamma-glutamate synthesis protein (capsule biosynthesis protein)
MMTPTRGQARCRRQRLLSLAMIATGLLATGGGACAQAIHNPTSTFKAPERDPRIETLIKITAPFTVAAMGDIITPQPLNREEPGFRKLVDTIRKSDVAMANMESSLVDIRNSKGAVAGTVAPLETGDAIKAMGITMMNRANNHTFDGGVMGMYSTDEALDKLGIVHAGTGRDLQEARSARYQETSKGRVGLVGMFSVEDVGNFGPTYARTEATYRNGPLGGAPGVNPLHLTTYHVVKPEHLENLKQIAPAVYGSRERAAVKTPGGVERFRFFDEWYEAGPDVGSLHYEIEPNDLKDILQSIRNGKIYADFMIATIHSHQTPTYCGECQGGGAGTGMKEGVDHYPPDFLVKLAHDSVDSGADMFVSHGVHALAGIEIYKGKPIFYGLSNFVFQFGLQAGSSYDTLANHKRMSELEHPDTQETVLTTSRFEDGKLIAVCIYPVELGGSRRPISRMGIPAVPTPEVAQRILGDMQEYSKPFGTRIAIENNVGVIRPGPDTQGRCT